MSSPTLLASRDRLLRHSRTPALDSATTSRKRLEYLSLLQRDAEQRLVFGDLQREAISHHGSPRPSPGGSATMTLPAPPPPMSHYPHPDPTWLPRHVPTDTPYQRGYDAGLRAGANAGARVATEAATGPASSMTRSLSNAARQEEIVKQLHAARGEAETLRNAHASLRAQLHSANASADALRAQLTAPAGSRPISATVAEAQAETAVSAAQAATGVRENPRLAHMLATSIEARNDAQRDAAEARALLAEARRQLCDRAKASEKDTAAAMARRDRDDLLIDDLQTQLVDVQDQLVTAAGAVAELEARNANLARARDRAKAAAAAGAASPRPGGTGEGRRASPGMASRPPYAVDRIAELEARNAALVQERSPRRGASPRATTFEQQAPASSPADDVRALERRLIETELRLGTELGKQRAASAALRGELEAASAAAAAAGPPQAAPQRTPHATAQAAQPPLTTGRSLQVALDALSPSPAPAAAAVPQQQVQSSSASARFREEIELLVDDDSESGGSLRVGAAEFRPSWG